MASVELVTTSMEGHHLASGLTSLTFVHFTLAGCVGNFVWPRIMERHGFGTVYTVAAVVCLCNLVVHTVVRRAWKLGSKKGDPAV